MTSRLICAAMLCASLALTTSENCSADSGLYPHSIVLNRSVAMRPPYFALHPPVYYGARYVRPYGLSPYAAPSMLQATPGYQGRINSRFEEPAKVSPVTGNPCCVTTSKQQKLTIESPRIASTGDVQSNPFAATALVSR